MVFYHFPEAAIVIHVFSTSCLLDTFPDTSLPKSSEDRTLHNFGACICSPNFMTAKKYKLQAI